MGSTKKIVIQPDHGFSIVEFVIVLAIIGILTAIAIPAYHDYLIRTQVNEVYHATKSIRDATESYRTLKGQFPDTTTALGISAPGAISEKIQTISISLDHTKRSSISLTVTLDPGKINIVDLDLILTATWLNGQIAWTCSAASTASPSDIRYAPVSCR